MLLSKDDSELFFKLHRSLMHFVNVRLKVAPETASPAEFSALPPRSRADVRNALVAELGLVEEFVDKNPADLADDETGIVLSWRDQVAGQFYVFRQLKKHMIFLSSDDPPVAYGVVALTDSFEELLGPRLPTLVETVLLPFKNRIVYDGVLSSYSNVMFGGGIKRSLNDSYRRAKESPGVVTSLPAATAVTPKLRPKPKGKRRRKKAPAPAAGIRSVLEPVLVLIDGFCREHLNEEYGTICRQLAEKLSRKRPSPLLSGKPATWACGIVRTIGRVNFLDDASMQPHMRLSEVDTLLGVSASAGRERSRQIREALKINDLDVDWTLPSRMNDNPRVWMIEVNGLVMDMREAPREVQETAFEKGLIPYIPALGHPGL